MQWNAYCVSHPRDLRAQTCAQYAAIEADTQVGLISGTMADSGSPYEPDVPITIIKYYRQQYGAS